MKLQLSEKRIVPGAMTVWSHHGPEVDLVLDLQNLNFKPNSITELFVFHVLDHLFTDDGQKALKSWYRCLAPGAKVHILCDDFEYITRAFVGGDIDIDVYNEMHNHPTQYVSKNLMELLIKVGFPEANVVAWFSGNPDYMIRKHYEFILTATKNGK